jgi:hypothetical protein
MPKTKKIELIIDGETKTAKVKFDHEEGYLILTCNDYNRTEIRFHLADIEELGKESRKE